MKLPLSLIFKHTLVLLAVLLVIFWIFNIAYVPKRIANIPLNIDGLLIIIGVIFILISAEKRLLKYNIDSSILQLTMAGSIIMFSAELIFQAIRCCFFTYENNLQAFILAMLVNLGYGLFIAFLIAFQLKTRRTKQLIWFIIAFIIVCNVLIRFMTLHT